METNCASESYGVTGEHCVLTRETGWIPIKDWCPSAFPRIMQWDANNFVMSFLPASKKSAKTKEDLIEVSAPNLRGQIMLGHAMPSVVQNPETHEWSVKNIAAAGLLGGTHKIITGGRFKRADNSGEHVFPKMSESHIRLLAIFRCCGYSGTGSEVIFSPHNKVASRRLSAILGNIKAKHFRLRNNANVYAPKSELPAWFDSRFKTLDTWIFSMTERERDIYLDEMCRWPDYICAKGTKKGSDPGTCSPDMLYGLTMATMTGKMLACRMNTAVIDYPRFTAGPVIRLDNCAFEEVAPSDCRTVRTIAERDIYYPETQTGYWLCEYRGKIYVSGSSCG